MVGLASVLIVGLVVVTSCSATVVEQAEPSDWRVADVRIHSALASTQDSVVLLEVQGDELVVTAFDFETGERRWTRPATVGNRVAGVPQYVFVDSTTAYFLAPAEDPPHLGESAAGTSGTGRINLVAVETQTGEVRWSAAVPASSDPNLLNCGANQVCVVVRDVELTLLSFDSRSGTPGATASLAPSDRPEHSAVLGYRWNEHGSEGLLTGSGDALGSIVGPTWQRSWSHPIEALFATPGVSPNGGWQAWWRSGAWIVWLGVPAADLAPSQPQGAFAMIDASGKRLWEAPGVPCPFFVGAAPSACLNAAEGAESPLGGDALGIDESNGEVRWSISLDPTLDLRNPGTDVVRVDEQRFIIKAAEGPVVVDLATGIDASGDGEAQGWCSPGSAQLDRLRGPHGLNGYVRYRSPMPCRLGVEGGQPSLPIPDFAGTSVDSWNYWVEGDVIVATRNRP